MDNKNSNSDEFLRLLLANQTRIYTYILGLVGTYHDADDVMQETTSELWKKFDEFTPGTGFVQWGIRVAYFKIQSFRQKKQRMNHRIIFDDDVVDKIVPKVEPTNKNLEKQLEAIRECIKKLKARDYQFLEMRYYNQVKPKEISIRLGLSLQNVYKGLARVHARLLKCVKQSLPGTIS